ncbi:hypothetical protein ACFO8O_02205 [Hephaestia sp. GCM10023244]|uniref:hypothetical protein n=1 Tax=unclassified Hephaestia TaxID=2631281 RepID=UPI002076FDBB|nr:hypothetical protein [Hephaestia sp. MAHUQ-44]MCM8729785.1 hypothetical protein [Hephaestia sp. MAHUQ-44]
MVTTGQNDRTERDAGPIAPALCDVLLVSLRALGDAGDTDLACRLAGRACAALRGRDSVQWRRFNVLLHRLAPRTGAVGTPQS